MELKVKAITFPELIEFNFDELKEEITAKSSLYKNMVYTDDTIKEAKADKAKLNKFIAALDDQRKDIKKQCLQPYEEFEKKVKELIAIVNEPVQLIDSQVKVYEEKKKNEKLKKIQEYWESTEHPEWLKCNAIFDPKWLNATFSLKKVQEAICDRLTTIQIEIGTIENLPEFSFEALEEYKHTLDINKAISEGQRLADIQKRKAEAEAANKATESEKENQKAEAECDTEVAEKHIEEKDKITYGAREDKKPHRQWIAFEAYMTTQDAVELKEFFEARNIIFRPVAK